MSSIIFFGTPELSRTIIMDIVDTVDMPVRAVVTQPDRPVGRHQVLTPSPVKSFAVEHGIPVQTPERLRGNTELFETLRAYDADWFIVAAYGRILPRDILDMPRRMCVNTHFSLLPHWRGASPIQASLLAGDTGTGVTIMEMSEGMDEGDILATETTAIRTDDTTATLTDHLAHMSAPLLLRTLRAIERGDTVHRIHQDSTLATYCTKIEKEHGRIDWHMSARDIYHRWQAFTPWPGIYTFFATKRLIIEACTLGQETTDVPAGTVLSRGDTIAVATAHGELVIHRVCMEGGRSQTAAEFVRGRRDFVGVRLPS